MPFLVFGQENLALPGRVTVNQGVEADNEEFDLNQILRKDENLGTSDQFQNRVEITQDVKVEQIVEPVNDYQYSSFGASSPFDEPASLFQNDESKIEESGPSIPGMPQIPIVSPLQKFKLGQLQVKGIWRLANSQWRAILLTPEQEGVIVKEGDPVSAGKVLSIGPKNVTIRQYKLRPDGTRFFSDKEIFLQKKKKPINGKNSDSTANMDGDSFIGRIGGVPQKPASPIDKEENGKGEQENLGGVDVRNP